MVIKKLISIVFADMDKFHKIIVTRIKQILNNYTFKRYYDYKM